MSNNVRSSGKFDLDMTDDQTINLHLQFDGGNHMIFHGSEASRKLNVTKCSPVIGGGGAVFESLRTFEFKETTPLTKEEQDLSWVLNRVNSGRTLGLEEALCGPNVPRNVLRIFEKAIHDGLIVMSNTNGTDRLQLTKAGKEKHFELFDFDGK